jgi:MFS family permease
MLDQRDPPAAKPWQARLPFFYGWVIVGLGFFSAFFGIGLTWAASLFAVPMREDLGWGNSALFFAISVRGWMSILVLPVIGEHMDRRHGVRVLALIGGLLNVVSLALVATVDQRWQFIVLFGIMGGIAQACQTGISVVIPKWFIRQRGFAISLSTVGGGLAAFILPPLLTDLNDSVGWRGGWLVIAGAALAFSVLPVTILRRQPEDVGLLPDGDSVPTATTTATPLREETFSFTRRQAIRTRTFWILLVGVSLGAMASNGIPSSLANIFVDRGLDFDTAATALVAYGLASMLAKVVWGWIANRMHLQKVLLLLTGYGALAIPSILIVPNSVGEPALAYGFITGMYIGAYVPLHGLVWATYFGRLHLGAINGVGRPFSSALMSGGPFILAATRDLTGSFTAGILLTGWAISMAFLCLYVVRPPRLPSQE